MATRPHDREEKAPPRRFKTMRQRSDPLVPVLASSVAFVVVGAIVLVFYPRISDLMGPERDSVVGDRVSATAEVPVWTCRSEEGVALMLTPLLNGADSQALAPALKGGPYHFLKLSVHNFSRDGAFRIELPPAGFASPGGGQAAIPAAAVLSPKASAEQRTVLRALGGVAALEVPRGHCGQALLVLSEPPGRRVAFVHGALRFERRKVERYALEAWRLRPDYAVFLDF